MHQQTTDQPSPALLPFTLTYSPAHLPSGIPLDRTASRQLLASRETAVEEAPSAQAAVDSFERRTNRMVTGCTRLQAGEAWQ